MLASLRKMGTRTWQRKRGDGDLGFLCSSSTHLLHPGTEVVQRIWIYVSIGDELRQIKILRMKRKILRMSGRRSIIIKVDLIQGHRLFLPFDKEDSFVLESAGPVGVDDEVTGSILRDHHRLWLLLVKKGLRAEEGKF